MTVGQALRWAQNELFEVSGDDATADARAFVCASVRVMPNHLLTVLYNPMQGREMTELQRMVSRRKQREPAQYIVGSTQFMGLAIRCDPRALIPRFETELLALEAQTVARANKLHTALDLCAGSGCVGIVLSLDGLDVTATDMSEDALLLAQENAAQHNAKIEFSQGDLFDAFEENIKFDLIVSNPPYIKTAEIDWLPEEINGHEPHLALDGGSDGFIFYRRIIKDAPEWLTPGGWLIFEVGEGMADGVQRMMEDSFEKTSVAMDLRGIGRVVKGRLKGV